MKEEEEEEEVADGWARVSAEGKRKKRKCWCY